MPADGSDQALAADGAPAADTEAEVIPEAVESDSDDSDDSSESESEEENEAVNKEDGAADSRWLPDLSPEPEGEDPDSPAANVRLFSKAFNTRRNRRRRKEVDEDYGDNEELFNFPKDPENWREEDLRELWADRPIGSEKPGWDPLTATKEDLEQVQKQIKEGKPPVIAPFYVPYRKPLPVVPHNHHDIRNPKQLIEELDRIEEFLNWVSYIFADGSSYEGTVWDDRAHGKGVYIGEHGLLRYEGEWFQNEMEGHGVIEVDIPDIEPIPGSKLEAEMRAKGKLIARDFMSPEDKKWLEMDIEDSVALAGGQTETPFYERDEWIKIFGEKPEKGRYRYAGQWKQGRMHGCGIYEVNGRIIYGRFYFGDHLENEEGCDMDISTLHSGIAEVAAAKARMFMNKPNGMVREKRGPYGDPQHPYFYEEEDVWMAPGFINQFYDVPDYWKVYAEEVDQEREMWLNSFYRSPLRIPMPAELEYWWSKGYEEPEFILVNKEPEPDPEDPTKLIYSEEPLIYHTRSGRYIDYVEDEEHGIRLYWYPDSEGDEEIDLDKAEFLPLGYDEFFGQTEDIKEPGALMRLVGKAQGTVKSFFENLRKWAEEKRKDSEEKLQEIESELELVEAEISLEEALEELDMELKMAQEEEEQKAASEKDDDKGSPAAAAGQNEDGPDDDIDEDDGAATSFGDVGQAEENGDDLDEADIDDSFGDMSSRRAPFSTLTLSLWPRSLPPTVLSKVKQSITAWRNRIHASSRHNCSSGVSERLSLVSFPRKLGHRGNLRAETPPQQHRNRMRGIKNSPLDCLARSISPSQACNEAPDPLQSFSILSFHVPVSDTETPLY